MAVTYTTAVKTARMTAVRDAWGASAKLEILDGATIVAGFTLSATVGDSAVANGVITLKFTGNSASQTVAALASANPPTSARIRTSGNTDIITGLSVSTTGGGGDIQLNSTNIGVGANVSITAASITHAA